MVLQLEVRRFAKPNSGEHPSGLSQKDLDFVVKSADFRQTSNPFKFEILRDENEAWLVVELVQKDHDHGSLLFSLSQTNPYFGKALNDTFENTFKLAQFLDASVYDCKTGQSIGADYLGNINNPKNLVARSLISQWEQSLNYINAENKAPAEFFVDGCEYLPEYFCIWLHFKLAPKFEDIIDKSGFSIRAKDDSQCAIYDKNTQRPVCKLFLHSSGILQIQPFYWKVDFAQAASETIQTAQLLQVLIDPLAAMSFFQFPLTSELLSAIEAARNSLGLDFNKWAQSHFGLQWNSRQLLHQIN